MAVRHSKPKRISAQPQGIAALDLCPGRGTPGAGGRKKAGLAPPRPRAGRARAGSRRRPSSGETGAKPPRDEGGETGPRSRAAGGPPVPPDGRKASTERARPTPGGRTERRASQRPRRTDNPPQAWRSPPHQPNRAQRGGHAAPERGARRRPDKASRPKGGREGRGGQYFARSGPRTPDRAAQPDRAANAAARRAGASEGGAAIAEHTFEVLTRHRAGAKQPGATMGGEAGLCRGPRRQSPGALLPRRPWSRRR